MVTIDISKTYETKRMDFKAEMKRRTMDQALAIIYFCNSIAEDRRFWDINRQLLRSATSVGANYRAALRGRSLKEFVAKLGIVEEEADESLYWLEIISHMLPERSIEIQGYMTEMNEILSIIVSSIRSSKRKLCIS